MGALSGRTVLVTGAGGFVGPHLCRTLARREARVAGLGEEAAPAGLEVDAWHVADLREPASLESAVAAVEPDFVVHLAGQSSAARSFEAPVETFQINATGTWNLLEAVRARAPRARVLIVGTGEIYGPQPEGSRVSESAEFKPVSPYALSKAAADALAEAHAGAYGLEIVRTRSFGHAGPGQAPRFVVSSFAQQIAAVEAGADEPVLFVGNLEVTRDLSDVRDIVEAYALLLERGRSGAAYNVCRGEGVRLDEITRELVARAKVPIRIEVDRDRFRPADVPYLVGDPYAIRHDTGWSAEIPLARTLDDVLEEWRGKMKVEGSPRA